MIRNILRVLRGKSRDEDGAATVEFVILFPAFIAIFLSAFEAGIFMVRNVMLERATDLAVRNLRLGMPAPPTYLQFKQQICDNTLILEDCMNMVQVELQPVSLTAWAPLSGDANCIDQAATIDPIDSTTFLGCGNNELMMVRICAKFTPMFPTTTLGLKMPVDDFGTYSLVTTTAFVNEPSR